MNKEKKDQNEWKRENMTNQNKWKKKGRDKAGPKWMKEEIKR